MAFLLNDSLHLLRDLHSFAVTSATVSGASEQEWVIYNSVAQTHGWRKCCDQALPVMIYWNIIKSVIIKCTKIFHTNHAKALRMCKTLRMTSILVCTFYFY